MSRPPFEVDDLVRSAGGAFIERNRAWIRWTHINLAPFNLHKARVRRASAFLLMAFSNARPTFLFRSTVLTEGAPPKKH